MTIIPVNDLTPHEIHHLGNNLDDAPARCQDDIDAMNRSLATLGETLDDSIDAAMGSEHVAG